MMICRKRLLSLTILAAGGIVCAAPSVAQAQISVANKILACRTVDNDIARLECFDQIATDVATPSRGGEMQPLSSVEPAPRSYAVIPAPSAPTPRVSMQEKSFGEETIPRTTQRETKFEKIRGKVAFNVKHIQTFDVIKKRFYMENGQVWEQTTTTDLDLDDGPAPKNMVARISKSGFGYKMKVDGERWGVKVRRVR